MKVDGEARRAVAVAEWMVPHLHIKIGRDTFRVSDPSPRPDCAVQGSSARKINPHNF